MIELYSILAFNTIFLFAGFIFLYLTVYLFLFFAVAVLDQFPKRIQHFDLTRRFSFHRIYPRRLRHPCFLALKVRNVLTLFLYTVKTVYTSGP